MLLITHPTHLKALTASDINTHITARFNLLPEDTDVPPIIILVKPGDDLTGPDYAFIGNRGLLSDLFEESTPGETGFVSKDSSIQNFSRPSLRSTSQLWCQRDNFNHLTDATDGATKASGFYEFTGVGSTRAGPTVFKQRYF